MDQDRDALVDQLKAKLLPIEEFLAGWRRQLPAVSQSVYGTALVTLIGFDDPRLLLVRGIGKAGSARVAWCLWGTAGNRAEDGGDLVSVPLPATLSNAARRTLQLLAVDQSETEEAASAELADTAVADEIAQLALNIRASEDDALAVEFGATVHAVLAGAGDVDVICLGTPVWLRAVSPERG